MEDAWAYSTQDALAHFGVNPSIGLTPDAVLRNQKLYGRNGEPPRMLQECL
jgi:Cation transporter/ATPase, N-terminus